MIEEKQKRQKRIQQKKRQVSRQLELRKRFSNPYSDEALKQPHRLQKKSAVTCGNPNCIMCGNPRKIFGYLTKQEMSFIQTGEWNEDYITNEETEESSCSSGSSP